MLTSLEEGLPRFMMEAMAARVPCVASKIRGNVDLIENRKGGYLCDPHNADEFAKAIKSCDTELRTNFKKNKLQQIKLCDVNVVKDEMKHIYKDILK